MQLRDRIKDDMKTAMKAGDKDRLGTVRLILAEIQKADVAAEMGGGKALDEPGVLGVLTKMVKQRRDSVEQFTKGNRPELAAKEQAEIAIIEAYMPQQMDEAAVTSAIKAAIAKTGANSPKDMGKVMGELKATHSGAMDFQKASALVKQMLSG
ncbi:MAG: Aspartyl/glutamyl-tRNA(Asn/Gln) amidotransferase subunit [Pseudomonadota bacterium]